MLILEDLLCNPHYIRGLSYPGQHLTLICVLTQHTKGRTINDLGGGLGQKREKKNSTATRPGKKNSTQQLDIDMSPPVFLEKSLREFFLDFLHPPQVIIGRPLNLNYLCLIC